MYIADLHIHSRYSRATSRDCDLPHLDASARSKGISIVGTGDFTHPAWRSDMHSMLEPAADGLFALKNEYILPDARKNTAAPLFVVSGEISTIYKKNDRTRKVHHLILLPSIEAADELSRKLELIGNIRSDGRPILGLDSRDLADITFDTCPEAIFIPAHIWTPHFSLFGEFSGFSTIEECYGDMARHIHALETGLSSDPAMNRLFSELDRCRLVSNSDAHSPAKLGREANMLDCEMTYPALRRALETGNGLRGTIEFFPEEGKYHMDGHRACDCRLTPAETRALNGRCPVCGRKLTVGVQHRVEALADRARPLNVDAHEYLMPLEELIADSLGATPASKKVQARRSAMLADLGSELHILREASIDSVRNHSGPIIAEALRRLRGGEVIREAGFDGVYGRIALFRPGERENLMGQFSFIDPAFTAAAPRKKVITAAEAPAEAGIPSLAPENTAQHDAITAADPHIAVIAGPGTGKTHTLVERAAYMISEMGVSPSEMTAVTFTNQAAAELRSRLEKKLGKRAVKGLTVGTFHSVCLSLLPKASIAGQAQAQAILAALIKERGDSISPTECLHRISALRSGVNTDPLPDGLLDAYREKLRKANMRDMDDILEDALETDVSALPMFRNLLVDEYQDINALQRRLVTHWLSGGGTLFVIGDPDQSIYGFRGASAGCFDELRAQLPDLRTIGLSLNYRSAPEVIAAALHVIDKNPGTPRILNATRAPGIPLRRISSPDPLSEAHLIAGEISRLTGGIDMNSAAGTQARAFSDIAVICRTRRRLKYIGDILRQEGIPCAVTGRSDDVALPGAAGALGFFRCLTNAADPISLEQALTGLWHADEKSLARAAEAFAACGADPDALENTLGACIPLRPWLDALRIFQPRVAKEKPAKLISELQKLTHANLAPIHDAAMFYRSMPALIEALDTGSESDIRRAVGRCPSGAVTLTTMHGAKGLEFPAVILAGMTDGEFPSGRAADMGEERRLFFVGITRARDELVFTSGGADSPFMDELPDAVARETAPAHRIKPAYEQLSFL